MRNKEEGGGFLLQAVFSWCLIRVIFEDINGGKAQKLMLLD